MSNNVTTNQFTADPYDYLCNTYDNEQLKDIAYHGCISGSAGQHIYYSETVEFFDYYEVLIYKQFKDIYGYSLLKEAEANGCETIQEVKNWATWWFIEDYATGVVGILEDDAA